MASRGRLGGVGRLAFGGALLWIAAAPVVANEEIVYERGDANSSGNVDLSDAIFVLRFLFSAGTPPVCDGAANANGDRRLDIADAVFLLRYLFNGAAAPPPLGAAEREECAANRLVRCGAELFASPDSSGNGNSCATCHGTSPAAAAGSSDLRLVAHGLGDAVRRPAYYNGQLVALRESVNECRRDWMSAPELAEADFAYRSLAAYLESLASAPDPAPQVSYHITPPAVMGPSAGDPVRGCDVFTAACSRCHGLLGQGAGALGPSIWTTPRAADELRRIVRLSGPTEATVPGTLYAESGLLGSRMPFWSAERLSDAELEDLVAYLAVAEDPARRDCDHVLPPSLLRSGNLQTFQHGVRGRVEHWSDRTIRLRDFNYDGLGPNDVLVWLFFKDNDIQSILRGYPISPHLGRPLPYIDENLEFSIPDEITDATFNSVSIWCTLFDLNYGDALLLE